jgi:hypothetical protein
MVSSKATLTSSAPYRCWEPAVGCVRARSSASPLRGSTFYDESSQSVSSCAWYRTRWSLPHRRGAMSGRCRYPMSSRWPWRNTSRGSAPRPWKSPGGNRVERCGMSSRCSQPGSGTPHPGLLHPQCLEAGPARRRAGAKPGQRDARPQTPRRLGAARERGQHPRRVRLSGHHDPGFTLRTYAHLMPESEDRARTAIDATLGAPAESTRNADRL